MANNKSLTFNQILGIVISIVIMLFAVNNYGKATTLNKSLETQLANKEKLAKTRKEENLKNRVLLQANANELNVVDLESDATVLFDTLLEFNDWSKYYENSIKLGEKYPKLKANPLIDTEGNQASTGKAPNATYEVKSSFINQSDKTEVFLVSQTTVNGTVTYTKDYYVKVTGSGQDFDVIDFKILKELVTFV